MTSRASLVTRPCALANPAAVQADGSSARADLAATRANPSRRATPGRRDASRPRRRSARAHARTRAARRGFRTIESQAARANPRDRRTGPPPSSHPNRETLPASFPVARANPTEPARPRSARAPLPARALAHRPAEWPKTVTAPLTLFWTPRPASGIVWSFYSPKLCRHVGHARPRSALPCT